MNRLRARRAYTAGRGSVTTTLAKAKRGSPNRDQSPCGGVKGGHGNPLAALGGSDWDCRRVLRLRRVRVPPAGRFESCPAIVFFSRLTSAAGREERCGAESSAPGGARCGGNALARRADGETKGSRPGDVTVGRDRRHGSPPHLRGHGAKRDGSPPSDARRAR